jgi:hypothetical protein
MQTARIDVRRLARALVFTLVAPLTLAIILDLSLDTLPLATLVASVIFIPLATVVVSRAALSELDKVIQAVAPLEGDSPEGLPDDEAAGEQGIRSADSAG